MYYYLYIEYLHLNHVQFQFVSTGRKNIPEQNERCESVIHQVYNAAGGVLQLCTTIKHITLMNDAYYS